MSLLPASILILAGGRGQRMGGRDKGLVEWRGQPLVAQVQAAVRPLTDDLVISCNRNAPRYAQWADQLVADEQPDFPGPLAGILAGFYTKGNEIPYFLVLGGVSIVLGIALAASVKPIKALMSGVK